MARIRSIKPDFFRHSGLYRLEIETGLPIRVAFAGLWTAADREGRFRWDPDALKLDALPYDNVDFSRVLDALATRGHIVRYASDGREFGWIPSWSEHQVINNRESASVLPDFHDCEDTASTCTRGARVDDETSTRLVHAQVEGKGREGNGKGKEVATKSPPPPSASGLRREYTAEFEEAWNALPRRPNDSKADAFKAWKARIREGKTADAMTAGAARYAAYCRAEGTEAKFVKQGGTFFGPGLHFEAAWVPAPALQATAARNAEARQMLGFRNGPRQETLDA